VYHLNAEDLKRGEWTAEWVPQWSHPNLPADEAMSKRMICGLGLALAGGFNISPTWNKLLPDFEFTQVETTLNEAWGA
jgi:hypothetical protein